MTQQKQQWYDLIIQLTIFLVLQVAAKHECIKRIQCLLFLSLYRSNLQSKVEIARSSVMLPATGPHKQMKIQEMLLLD